MTPPQDLGTCQVEGLAYRYAGEWRKYKACRRPATTTTRGHNLCDRHSKDGYHRCGWKN